MTELNKNTKKAQCFLSAREKALQEGNFTIYAIYARPSETKKEIAQKIKRQYKSVVFHSGNCSLFTASGIDEEGNTIILTKDNEYKIVL